MTAKAGRADVYRAGKLHPSYFVRWEVPQFPGVQTVGRREKKIMKQEKKQRELLGDPVSLVSLNPYFSWLSLASDP